MEGREKHAVKEKREEAKGRGNKEGQRGGMYYPQEDLSLTLEPGKQSQFLSFPPPLLPYYLFNHLFISVWTLNIYSLGYNPIFLLFWVCHKTWDFT